MKIFLFAASASSLSVNKKLASIIEKILQDLGHEIDHAQFEEFPLPLYCADLEKESGVPKEVSHFTERMQSANKIIFVSPEYNASIPGTFKNLIDWVSRIKPMPWKDRDILLASASPSIYGGMRGLLALHVPLEVCGAFIFPKTYSLSNALEAFDDQATLKDQKQLESLWALIDTFTRTHIVRDFL